jgi:hypothetical protein
MAVIVVTTSLSSGCTARVIRTDATPLLWTRHALDPRTTYSFSVENLSVGGDTVMHLVWLRPGGRVEEVARNDDASPGTKSSAITYTPTFQGQYAVLVRAKDRGSAGTCDLQMSGAGHTSTIASGVPFAGSWHRVYSSADARQYVYESALQPGTGLLDGANGRFDASTGAARDTFLLALDRTGAVIAFDDDSGVGSASRITEVADVNQLVVGTRDPARAGYTVVYVNDGDGDGLGPKLERAIGTCDHAGDPGYADVFNPRDTDRDGLEDSLELLGREAVDPWTGETRSLLLPAWSADPRRKDVFVELDYRDDFVQLPFGEEDAAIAAGFFARAPADHVFNPDGRDGVSLRLTWRPGLPIPRTSPSSGRAVARIRSRRRRWTAPSRRRNPWATGGSCRRTWRSSGSVCFGRG